MLGHGSPSIANVWIASEALLYVLTFDIEFAELAKVVNNMMSNFHSFFRLFQGIFVPMNLRKNGAVLKFQFGKHLELPHTI